MQVDLDEAIDAVGEIRIDSIVDENRLDSIMADDTEPRDSSTAIRHDELPRLMQRFSDTLQLATQAHTRASTVLIQLFIFIPARLTRENARKRP